MKLYDIIELYNDEQTRYMLHYFSFYNIIFHLLVY